MPWILLHQTCRQTYFRWWTPQSIKKRCLEYCYTTLGRWTYFGWWTPQLIEHRCLEYQYTKLGRQTYFGRWTPQWIENRCLEYLLHKNLADEPTLADGPPSESRIDALNTSYTKLGRQTYFGRWTPQLIEHRCLEYCYTKLGRQTYFGRWTPQVNRE